MAAIAKLKLVERPGVAPPAEEAVDAETDVQKELGCVDISPQPDKRGGEVEEAEVVATKLVEAREAAPVVLELIEKALDEVPLFVQLAVILRLLFAVSLG